MAGKMVARSLLAGLNGPAGPASVGGTLMGGQVAVRRVARASGSLTMQGRMRGRMYHRLAARACFRGSVPAASPQSSGLVASRMRMMPWAKATRGGIRSMTSFHSAAQDMPFNNVEVDCRQLEHLSHDQFVRELDQAVQQWQQDGRLVAWLQVPLSSAWMATAASQISKPFEIHHARDGTIKMMRWLDETRESRVPPYNTHQVAVGGLVITDEKEVLAIKEKQAVIAGFKLPGGRADPGEHFGEAVEREVLEETGVRVRFHSVVGIRHMHGFRHGASDLYVICRCVPETREITMCEEELGDARWMPLEDYIADTMPLNQLYMSNVKRSVDAANGKHNEMLLDIDLPEVVMPSPYRANQAMHFYHAGDPGAFHGKRGQDTN